MRLFQRVKATGGITLRELTKDIFPQKHLELHRYDCGVGRLVTVIPEHIAEGQIVRMGDLGSLHLSVKTEGRQMSPGADEWINLQEEDRDAPFQIGNKKTNYAYA